MSQYKYLFLVHVLVILLYCLAIKQLSEYLKTSPRLENLLWNNLIYTKLVLLGETDRSNQAQNKIDLLTKKEKLNPIKLLVAANYQANAFAAPTNKIIITHDLLTKVKNENSLLFIIGHEIGHIINKDYLYYFSKTLVNKVFKLILANDFLLFYLNLFQTKKVKQIEFLADQWAVKLLYEHYGHLRGLNDLIIEHQQQEEVVEFNWELFPSWGERLRNIKQFISKNELQLQ